MKYKFTKKQTQILQKTLSILLALLVWQVVSMLISARSSLDFLFASPLAVVKRMWSLLFEVTFISSLWFTFQRIAGGFFLAMALGVVLAVLAGRFQFVEILLWPYMVTIKSVPVASFVIFILICVGSSSLSVFISALMVLPIIYTNTLTGIRSTDPELDQMAEVFAIPFAKRLFYVKLPQIKPFFMSGVTVSLGLAWKSGVAAELIGQPDGSIGEALYLSKIWYKMDELFCWTIVIILLSFCFEKLVLFIFERLFRRLERLS